VRRTCIQIGRRRSDLTRGVPRNRTPASLGRSPLTRHPLDEDFPEERDAGERADGSFR
jgi:hypothetical protein